MKITAEKIKKELIKKYDWTDLDFKYQNTYDLLIRNTLKIVDEILKQHKGFSIK